jgi:hypothetical protein
MKEIFMKYNPFTLDTEIEVDGDNYSKKNNFSFNKKKRLQEWIDSFIKKLDDELNYNGSYHIKFHGTKLDYEDINEAIKKLENREIQLEHIETKEITDRKKEVKNIFYEIQNNSYDLENLKSEDLKDRFEKILNSEFEINVIATMSSGKSTLINSLLSKKILPSSNEACTATITRIKDIDNDNFIGKAYDEKGELKYAEYNISYEKMREWNKAEDILTIELQGNIPFVEASEISLVITDTPGPNNSKDKSHRQRLMNMLDGNKYKPLILYVLNATQFGITDDSELLKSIVKKLENADKQTKDSFLFVVNKIDTFNDDDDIQKTLENIKTYLEEKGITEPNILPVAALPALEIRSEPKSPKQQVKRKQFIEFINIDENLYLEKYISLPPKAKQEIENELKQAIEEGEQEKTALIHTGIPSLEKIIKTYIEKYAIAIKIKDLTDLFKGLVNDELNTNKLSKQINETNDNSEILKLKEQIKNINYEISDLEKFDSYNKQIRESSRSVADNLEIKIKEIREKMKEKVTDLKNEITAEMIEKTIKIEEAEKHHKKVIKEGKAIEIELKDELQKTIQESLIRILEGLYKEYVNRIKKLTLTGNKIINEKNLAINPFEIIGGSIESFKSFDEFRAEYSEKKYEVIGTEEVENKRDWWEFWRWFEPSTKTISVYGDVEYVNMEDFLDLYHNDIESLVFKTTDEALQYGKKEISKVEKQFIKTKEQLDSILKNKLEYISELLQNKEKTSERIKIKSEMYAKKIEWLKNIKNRIENVIEI